MKSYYRCPVLCIVALMLCLLISPAFALGYIPETGGRFPDGVIEVPIGTDVSINNDNNTVTISNCPVDINEGDTFVVYLQELPIGYVANSITVIGNKTIIEAEKADKSIYAHLEEESVIYLTGDMYEFVPAGIDDIPETNGATIGYSITDYLKYEDGKLTVTVKPIDGAKIAVELSNMSLYNSFSGGEISVVLSGNWKVSSELSTQQDSLGEVELGELRIYGVGKIALVLDITHELAMKYTFSGSFSAGFKIDENGNGQIIKNFSTSQKSVEGKGSISVSLKITAGVDLLVVEGDVYAEIGVKTQYSGKTTYHSDWNPPRSVRCDDFKFYIFSNIGVEAKYQSASGKKKKIYSTDFELLGEKDNPYLLDVHFEDGVHVSGCSEGMDTSSIDMDLGGITSEFGSTLFTGGRDRILETSVNLPWDIETDGDYFIYNGNLNLNGHTLTVNGDLIQSGGTLTIGSGTLIVHGNYRMQSLSGGIYGDSTGKLNMNSSEGTINIDGSLILQTKADSHSVSSGTINIIGDIVQINPNSGTSHFNTGTGCVFVLTADNNHILRFADAANNSIGWINMLNSVTAETSVHLGRIDMNGHPLVVNGSLTTTGAVDFQDLDPEPPVYHPIGDITLDEDAIIDSGLRFNGMNLNGNSLTVNGDMISTDDIDLNGGILTVTGSLYQQDGRITVNKGILDIGGNYYMAGAGSSYTPGRESFKTADCTLTMANAQDEVRVGGEFCRCNVWWRKL